MLKAKIGKRIRKQRIDSGLTQAELEPNLVPYIQGSQRF